MVKNNKYRLIIIFLAVASLVGTGVYFITENSSYEDDILSEANTSNAKGRDESTPDGCLQNDNSIEEYSELKKEESSEEEINLNSNDTNKILVHIDGSVNNPGIVALNNDSRLLDAIEKAGGLTQEADIRKINLASYLEDGMKVYIPNKNDQKDVTDNVEIMYSNTDVLDKNDSTNTNANTKTKINSNAKININNASIEGLKALPGVGDGTASKIVEYRNKNGKFKKIEDIKNVKGIGDNKYKKIKDYICVK